MTLRLILEHTPSAQSTTEMAFHGGQLVVGRGDEADWHIDDPDKFVSRKHFVISEEGGRPVVTDASTGGTFVDGSSQPLGLGNSHPLENGMRLRFGDFVARIEMESGPVTQATPQKAPSPFDFDFSRDLSEPPVQEPQERPDELPTPFGMRPEGGFRQEPEAPSKPPQPIDRDDPFALDFKPATGGRDATSSGGGGYFAPRTEQPEPPRSEPPKQEESFGFDLDPSPKPKPQEPVATQDLPQQRPVSTNDDAALRAAFFKGLGVTATDVDDPLAEMEAMGRRFRAMTEGLVHLLRTRAEEKQKVRVAQTIIGAANVNPLKFAVGGDDAVSALVSERGAGYLDPDAAISESYRDLADHQVRTWSALQVALRQMIDRFDPEEIEREMEDTGLIGTLMAGGRRSKLWELYQERYKDIARSAEERFLGEVGADFRDAYEGRNSR